MLNNVIDITSIMAIKEIGKLLELSADDSNSFFNALKSGNTLAEALRKIGIVSASQISLKTWPLLRKWRDVYFPNNVKIKV